MCLVALALGQSDRFPLVLASNRDEYLDRPSAALDWWARSELDGGAILAGRDLQAGGTWLGLNSSGRLALVTNIRAADRVAAPKAPSRGMWVPRWLSGEPSFASIWHDMQEAGCNGFNLIAADAARGAWLCASNTGAPPRALGAGLYGLSNAALDTPWPKTLRLKARVGESLRDAERFGQPLEVLAAGLFDALGDTGIAPTHELPSTGVPLALERELSAAFIRTADGRYGTRCSTLVITERTGSHSLTHVIERSYGRDLAQSSVRQTTLPDWPPAVAR